MTIIVSDNKKSGIFKSTTDAISGRVKMTDRVCFSSSCELLVLSRYIERMREQGKILFIALLLIIQ